MMPREQLSHDNAADYKALSKVTDEALWAYSAPDPDNAGKRYLALSLMRVRALSVSWLPATTPTLMAPKSSGFVSPCLSSYQLGSNSSRI